RAARRPSAELAKASIFRLPRRLPRHLFPGQRPSGSISERHLGQGASAVGGKFNFNTPLPVNTLGTANIPNESTTDSTRGHRPSKTGSSSNSSTTDDNPTTTSGPGPVNTTSNNGSSSTVNTPQRTSTSSPPPRSTDLDTDPTRISPTSTPTSTR
ncbi:hypothetical protein ACRAWF_43585, partial [Streptomyces sp. L7]